MTLEPHDVTYFENPDDFHAWLQAHHSERAALWVGYWRKATRKQSVTWEETVDVALCFGWIDGIRKKVDEEAYTIRFTPRRRGSIWSLRNVERYGVMLEEGRVQPAGRAAWEKRTEAKTGVYSYEASGKARSTAGIEDLDDSWMERLEGLGLAAAWKDRAPSWRKKLARWVMTAKKEETRERRFGKMVEDLAGDDD